MTPWTREDTREYIQNLEEEIEIYLTYKLRVESYLESKGYFADNTVLYVKCYILAFAWISHHLDRELSIRMIYDLIGIENDVDPNQGLVLAENFLVLDFNELMDLVIQDYI
jgi:hypothetical protein